MLAEKKDGRSGADNANVDYLEISSRQRCPPDRLAGQDQPSALFREQNLARRLRAYSPVRTSEFAIRCVCCSPSPIQELALRSRATPAGRAGAALLSMSGGCRAAGLKESEPGLRSPAEYFLT